MALNFPIPTLVGQVYQDPTSGNTYVCTSLGPPAQWVGSGSSTSLDSTYLRTDASNDPVTGNLILEPTTNVNPLLVKQPSGNTTPALRIENSGTGNSIEVGGVFSVSSSGVISTTGGTAAAPVISPTGDSNTGFFYPAADTVAISTNGVLALQVAPDLLTQRNQGGSRGFSGHRALSGYIGEVLANGYILISRVDAGIFANNSEFSGNILVRRGSSNLVNRAFEQYVSSKRAYDTYILKLGGPFPVYTLTYNSQNYYALGIVESVKGLFAVDVYVDARVQGDNIGLVVGESEVSNVTLFRNANQSYSQSNILGTVSQSGGVPTGAIIERGSNVNGEFIRYADGTQLCTLGIQFAGNVKSYTWTFPAAFFVPAGSISPSRRQANRSISVIFSGGGLVYGDSSDGATSFTNTRIDTYRSATTQNADAGTSVSISWTTVDDSTYDSTRFADFRITAIGRWY